VKCCGNCGFSYALEERGRVACGAPVDDAALHDGSGINPIWAERKYSFAGIMLAASGRTVEGSDCEDLSIDDGQRCKTWRDK
jgi:hypothetical protein